MANDKPTAVRMRKADSTKDEFHILEELSKPMASLSAGQIALWVYRTGPIIREVVLAGHAEPRTCSSATSTIIEAAKSLGDSVEWMLTCGAAHFRVSVDGSKKGPSRLGGAQPGAVMHDQQVLAQMIEEFTKLADETGLIQIMHRDWQELAGFRDRLRRPSSRAGTRIVLPDAGAQAIADYVPIIPDRSPDGQPLIFRFEGWDFDGPAFQAVADRHLRKVRREMLRDALRRRTRYRAWLKDWVERWIRELKELRQESAETIRIDVPGPIDEVEPQPENMDLGGFFKSRLREFVDESQEWPRRAAYQYARQPFATMESGELDKERMPESVNEIDFERGIAHTRAATAKDAFTLRERIMRNTPGLVSTCLRYIRRMDAIIKPYEDLRLWRHVGRDAQPSDRERTRKEKEAACVSEISRQIVIETMIRGWPSFYLDDKSDQKVFDAWAETCRPHMWSLMARQAAAAGVSIELLLEHNVVYDVRFDEDLGVTVQPLMLADNVSHAQVHGSRAGATAIVPLWQRHESRPIPPGVLSLGSNNRERAAALVEQARILVDGGDNDRAAAAGLLRMALACHGGEAGKRIVAEWSRRLGRESGKEFETAREMFYAKDLCSRSRFDEAKQHLDAYFAVEERPARCALVMNALCEMMAQSWWSEDDPAAELREFEAGIARSEALREYLGRELGKSLDAMSDAEFREGIAAKPHVEGTLREMSTLKQQIETLQKSVEEATKKRCELVERALKSPASVKREFPAVAAAASEAPEELRRFLELQCRAVPIDLEMVRRYGDLDKVVEMREVFLLLHRLSAIRHGLETDDAASRQGAMTNLRELSTAPWLPERAERDLKYLADEFKKGEWDRLLANQIDHALQSSMSVCYARIQELLGDLGRNPVPLSEPLATKVHIAQTIDGKYQQAFRALMGARVALGRATRYRWTVLDSDRRDLPPDARLQFNARKRTISLVSGGQEFPLVQASRLASGESDYVAAVVDDSDLLRRINPFAVSIADGLLAAEVDPRPEWHAWRLLMDEIGRELLFTMAVFSYEASPMPEYAPPRTPDGEEAENRFNQQQPRDTPMVDPSWAELGEWRALIGEKPSRSVLGAI